MIAKIVHDHICLREETLSFNIFVYLVLLQCTTVSIVGTLHALCIRHFSDEEMKTFIY